MINLADVLEDLIHNDPAGTEQIMCVLHRLSFCVLSPELNRSSGIGGILVRLAEEHHQADEVYAFSTRLTHTWNEQVRVEIERRKLASKRGPKPRGTGVADCRACQGAHRPHTCV